MDIGIIIAVSEYTGDAGRLPACSRDGAALAEVLGASGRFEDVLRIDDDTTSTHVKQRLADFASKHRGKEIGQVVFYFTGHGEFIGDEFYYLLSDYQSRRRKQTSLENSELDDIVRSLNPLLYVKIVDACHSGVSYIKSSEEFGEYLKSAKSVFRKIYFLFSSQSAQFSYQDEKISYFTESVIKAISFHSADTIRYKDIIDYVSDDFENYESKTPFFVTQADFTEVFCDVSQDLRDRLAAYIKAEMRSKIGAIGQGREISILDRLKADAKNFCSKEEAIGILNSLPDKLKGEYISDDLREIYQVSISTEPQLPPGAEQIGKWLEQNKDEKGYFAKPALRAEVYKERVPVYERGGFTAALLTSFGEPSQTKLVDKTRMVISGFDPTFEVPFRHIVICLSSKLPNVAPEECYVVAIVSRTHIRLFWSFAHFEASSPFGVGSHDLPLLD